MHFFGLLIKTFDIKSNDYDSDYFRMRTQFSTTFVFYTFPNSSTTVSKSPLKLVCCIEIHADTMPACIHTNICPASICINIKPLLSVLATQPASIHISVQPLSFVLTPNLLVGGPRAILLKALQRLIPIFDYTIIGLFRDII